MCFLKHFLVLSFGFAVEEVQLLLCFQLNPIHFVHYWNFLGDETFINIFIASISTFKFSMYFLIKSIAAFSLENSDVCVSIRTGGGMGVSSGKMISDVGDVSVGKVLPSFSTIKYEFLSRCSLFSSLLALMRSRSRSSNCSVF